MLAAIVESALRAAAPASITTVIRSWDFFGEDETAQPLLPYLVVSVQNDVPLLIGGPLYTAELAVGIAAHWSDTIRADLETIRGAVRSAVVSLPHVSFAGITIDGVKEISCTEPTFPQEKGDVVCGQNLGFRLWFTAPVTPPAVLDPEPYLIDRRPDGTTYVTADAADPRKIVRYAPAPSGVSLAYAVGDWGARLSLEYSPPLPPLSTSPALNCNQPPSP